MKRLLTTLVLLIACVQGFSQYAEMPEEEAVNRKVYHGLGFVAGRTAGLGLAYQYHVGQITLQGAFLPLKNEERELFNVGLSVMYTLVNGSSANLFIMQSNMYYINHTFEQKNASGYIYQKDTKEEYWNHGLGIGVATDGNAIRLYLSGGYGAFQNFEIIDFTVDAGLFYHF